MPLNAELLSSNKAIKRVCWIEKSPDISNDKNMLPMNWTKKAEVKHAKSNREVFGNTLRKGNTHQSANLFTDWQTGVY